MLFRRHRAAAALSLLPVALALLVGERLLEAPGMAEMNPTPATIDPGPRGDFAWKGLNWRRRTSSEGGRPAHSGRWDAANVIGPDARGWIRLRLTNPTGNAPTSAEFDSTRLGFGYGTYTIVVDADLSKLDPTIVFGGLFTYDSTTPSWTSHSEIDVNETSAWGHGVVQLDNAYFRDNVRGARVGRSIVVRKDPVPAARVQTHQMTWEPGRITWRSWLGAGGRRRRPFREAVATKHVPRPGREAICFNLWDHGAAGAHARETEVTIRDFSFVPLESADD